MGHSPAPSRTPSVSATCVCLCSKCGGCCTVNLQPAHPETQGVPQPPVLAAQTSPTRRALSPGRSLVPWGGWSEARIIIVWVTPGTGP